MALDPARAGIWADRLIDAFGGAAPAVAVSEARIAALLGCPRAAALIAAHRRAMLWTLRERAVCRPLLATRHAFLNYLHHRMAFAPEEALRAFFLNVRRELIAEEEIACGSPTALAIEPRHVLACALALGATGLILVHNHPGGDPTPSPADRRFTRQLAIAGTWLGVRLHDHLVVAREGHAIVARPVLADE